MTPRVLMFLLIVSLLTDLPWCKADLVLDEFPPAFIFGVSSSAFPTEGAWNVDGKSASIWDTFTDTTGKIQGGENAKDASKGYSKIKEDVQLLKSLGVSHYKFSLSWPRLVPDPLSKVENEAAFNHYNELIDELLANQIEPFVTLYHWDLPQVLQDMDGWANPESVHWFREYANVSFARFGDRVKFWTTIDDPLTLAYKGYGTGKHAPGLQRPDLVYQVGHNLLLAHANAYRLYNDYHRNSQQGQVGITLNSDWFVAKTGNPEDLMAAERALAFSLGWFAEPLFRGDYPAVMKERVALKGALQNDDSRKMPEFSIDEQARVKGAFDFLGLSHFKTRLVSEKVNNDSSPGYYEDQDLVLEADLSYPKLEFRPEINPNSDKRLMGFGLKDLLDHVTTKYQNPVIYVTQNGLQSCGTLQDQHRIEYIREYSNSVLQAILAGSDVRGYFVWSLLDGFDWDLGYTSKTGLYYVDFLSDDRTRYPRSSAYFYSALISSRGLNDANNTLVDYRAYPADRNNFYNGTFPDGFMWGVATAAYQIEGGWDADGKGPSIWDTFAHNHRIHDNQTGDVTCDSYHYYMDDVDMMTDLGVTFYRFSISWTRVLPDGTKSTFNQPGVDYYNNLIDALLARNITPFVTLYHWDLPQAIEDWGGWLNDSVVDAFEEYARVCFEQFGDRVKHWITFNEPYIFTYLGYGIDFFPPGLSLPGTGVYTAGHNVIRSHTRVYRMYKKDFFASQGGIVGFVSDTEWEEPLTPDKENVDAARRAMDFHMGWFLDPIYGDTGDYPEIMKTVVADKSGQQGFNKSRLPMFTDEEKQLNKGAYDFLGLNHYSSRLARMTPLDLTVGFSHDMNTATIIDPCWPGTNADWLRVNPWGIRSLLNWANEKYNSPPIYITENGRPGDLELEDPGRTYYLKYYTNEILKAIRLDGVDVRGYTVWSLMDNLEWADGYTFRFGLYQVNFTDPNRTRTARDSAHFYKELIAKNGFV